MMQISANAPAGGRKKSALGSLHLFEGQYRVAAVTVFGPIVGFVAGCVYIAHAGLPLFYVALWAVMHFIGMAGISVGFHRLASHQSFKGTRWAKRALLIMGSMSAQGPVVYWATNHRRHHHKVDQIGDVHSPYFGEAGQTYHNPLIGLWQAHTGWMFRSNPSNPVKYSLDLLKDRDVFFVNRHYYWWVALGIVLPGALAYLVFRTPQSFALGVLAGGIMRVFTVQHVTWAINSLTHMYGRRPYKTSDKSTNLFWLALPTTGESWHNNHHAFPSSSRLGLEWWQLDTGWLLLLALRALGLVWDLKVPTKEKLAEKRLPA
jgi:stearoyl-CoA desaturase (delta-9 desaturase)